MDERQIDLSKYRIQEAKFWRQIGGMIKSVETKRPIKLDKCGFLNYRNTTPE